MYKDAGRQYLRDEMDDEEVGWDDFGKPSHVGPQKPTGESIWNSIMWDEDEEDDDDVVGGYACMQMCRDGTARCACRNGRDEMDDEEVGWGGSTACLNQCYRTTNGLNCKSRCRNRRL